MTDPLSQVVSLLRPRAVFANLISGKGEWAIRYPAYGRPSFCIMLDGRCQLALDGQAPITIGAGDFILLPTTPGFTLRSGESMQPILGDPHALPEDGREIRYGEPSGEADMRSLGGAFAFDGNEPDLLVSLLPTVVRVHGATRLAHLVSMVAEETLAPGPGATFMLTRLVELLLIEAIRSTATTDAPPGLLRGLGDTRLAAALTQLHARIDHPWTVAQLARSAALSRSAFFERFTRVVGVAPMEYLLTWRMEIAKDLLRRGDSGIAAIAERIGYGSGSAFSVAFQRHVGLPPGRYAQDLSPPSP